MGLSKIRLGEIVLPFSQKCGISNLTPEQISGVNREKEFFEPSHQVGEETSKYQIVPPKHFACNLMHVGRDKVLPIAFNHTNHNKVVSPAYTVFSIKEKCSLIDDYFFLMLKSDERDRFFWFHADSSVRDGMPWSEFCNLELAVPDLPTQQKYVDIYKAMVANQQSYERGLEDLKLVCDGYIEDLRRRMPCEKIGPYLIESDQRNESGLSVDFVRGLSTNKEMIATKANMDGVDLNGYKTVTPGQIAYVPDTSRRGDKMSLGFNDTNETYIVSSIYTVFGTNAEHLIPEYLMLFFTRSEFDRYARFNSWGSARETFDWEEMCSVKIPIPDIKVQKAIAEVYAAYTMRKQINEKLKAQIKNMNQVLIKGSLEEGKNEIYY